MKNRVVQTLQGSPNRAPGRLLRHERARRGARGHRPLASVSWPRRCFLCLPRRIASPANRLQPAPYAPSSRALTGVGVSEEAEAPQDRHGGAWPMARAPDKAGCSHGHRPGQRNTRVGHLELTRVSAQPCGRHACPAARRSSAVS